MAEPRYETLEELTSAAVFVVEASSFEKQSLWERWAQQSPHPAKALLDWQDCGRGWLIQIGELDDRPINLSILGATLNGQHVLFYEAVSQVVDYLQVEGWLKEHCWPKWDNGMRRAHCDAINFHHCVEAVNALSQRQGEAMSTTKPDTDTGWTEERPSDNGVYWHRQSGMLPEVLFVQDGFVFDFGDNEPTGVGFYDGRGEWLGPLHASDFEQLIQLRKEASSVRSASRTPSS